MQFINNNIQKAAKTWRGTD